MLLPDLFYYSDSQSVGNVHTSGVTQLIVRDTREKIKICWINNIGPCQECRLVLCIGLLKYYEHVIASVAMKIFLEGQLHL